MKKISFLMLIALSIYLAGCSIPSVASYRHLYSFTRQESVKKGMAFGSNKSVSIQDFRGNQMYDEDMTASKENIEKYIVTHPDLKEQAKSNLRELKVTEGASKEEVELLLGQPDKIIKAGKGSPYAASVIWVYQINKVRAFTVFIIPVFIAHEGYYLYLKDNILVGIERHYLQQMVQQSPAAGVFEQVKKDNTSNK